MTSSCRAVLPVMVKEDIHNIMRHRRTKIASDGGIKGPSERAVHSKHCGIFARLTGH